MERANFSVSPAHHHHRPAHGAGTGFSAAAPPVPPACPACRWGGFGAGWARVWVDDVHFNLEYHVRHTALPSPGSDVQLEYRGLKSQGACATMGFPGDIGPPVPALVR